MTTYELSQAASIEIINENAKGWTIRCPNPEHDDEHPSAQLYHDGWIRCFACGYSIGLRKLAKDRGVTGLGSFVYEKPVEKPYEFRECTVEHHIEKVIGGSADGTITGERTVEFKEKFNLFEASKAWHRGFKAWIKSRGISNKFLDDFYCFHWVGGLLKYDGIDGLQDFKYRLAIPLADDQDRLIGFEFRKYDGFDFDSPKVLYPSHCPHKRFLWNQHALDRFKTVYVAEGILDLTKLYDLGITNIAATYGSELSQLQLQYLANCPSLVWILDRDEAGMKAVKKVGAINPFLRVLIPTNADLGADSIDQTQDALKNRIVTFEQLMHGVDHEWLLANDEWASTEIQYTEDE